MLKFHPASRSDLVAIYHLQNKPFRDRVFANRLPVLERFLQEATTRLEKGEEQYYILEEDKSPIGFTQYLKTAEEWDVIYWGKWINTLTYASFKVAFEDLGLKKLRGAVRDTNKRMLRIHERLGIRRIGRESLLYMRELFGGVAVAHFIYFEITAEEFLQKRSMLRKHSLEIVFS